MQLSIFKFSKNSQNSHHGPESLTAAQHGTGVSVSELVSQVTGRPKPLEQDPQAQIENTAVGWINFLPSHFTHVVTFDGKKISLYQTYSTEDKVYTAVYFQMPNYSLGRLIFSLASWHPNFISRVSSDRDFVLHHVHGTIVHHQGPPCLGTRWHVTRIRIPGLVFTSEGNLRCWLTDTCAARDANLASLFSNWRTGKSYEQLWMSLILIPNNEKMCTAKLQCMLYLKFE